MHECKRIQEQMVDLLFGEADAKLRAEIEGCAACREEYAVMERSLGVFDHAERQLMPPESYWPGYEARLRARLARAPLGGFLARWRAWFPVIELRPMPFALGTAAILLLLVLGGFWLRGRPNTGQQIVNVAPSPTERRLASTPESPPAQNEVQPRSAPRRPKKQTPPRPAFRSEPREEFIASAPVTASFLSPEAMRHFEQAQLLLRSFRNSRDATGDLEYEKQRSRKLLLQNIVIRRDAEAKGGLPTEGILGMLEPLLLDIANLPEKPDREEIGRIRQRIARQDAIAVLHPYVAHTDWVRTRAYPEDR